MAATTIAAALMAVLAFGAAGCVLVAPHGSSEHHQRHVDGVDIVFDDDIGCYRVRGHHSHYFHRGRFFRYHVGNWYAGPHIHGPWVVIEAHHLPLGLRKHWSPQ